jgi:hypothetical protein
MTNDLTDAVRRLKELQSDVERLKAARDQEGEPRLFFEASEVAVAIDALSVAGADLSALDVAVASDAQAGLVASDIDAAETATATDAQAGLVASDIDAAERAAVTDALSLFGGDLTAGAYNSTSYNTTTYQ